MSKARKAKPVVKVYCLPPQTEEQLQSLHKDIVAIAILGLDGFEISSERDLLVLFPPDSMKYGLGSEILAEIGLPMNPQMRAGVPAEFATMLGHTIKRRFPKSFVQCTSYRFDPADSWAS